ncbi:hypothetical protein Tco_0506290 [Tanacetum coccineum]
MIEADRLLAERLQTREQDELTDEEKARLFADLLEKRQKHFAALRAKEKRNKPPTKAQKKSTMSTYLKHMGGYKHRETLPISKLDCVLSQMDCQFSQDWIAFGLKT